MNTPGGQKIAVVGTGIAGSVAAYHLASNHDISVFEADNRVGGHTHTHEVERDGRTFDIDTGFIVFNQRTYPNFIGLLEKLGVSWKDSDMSFSVRHEGTGLEYKGSTLNTLFAQRSNLLRPSFFRMVRDILRFNREAPAVLEAGDDSQSLTDYLAEQRYSREFVEHFVVPMGAAIWSATASDMRQMPARFFIRFFDNHGMLSVNDRPTWRVIEGGSQRYLDRLIAGHRDRIHLDSPVEWIRREEGRVVLKPAGAEALVFDHVFLACHSDQALRMLADPTPEEQDVLGAIRYQENETVLHTDQRLLPRRRLAWAAWNYHILERAQERVALTYNMNILQGIDAQTQFCVTLNNTAAIDERQVIQVMQYSHPVFTPAAVAAQARHRELNGARRTYYCGAYWRNGFHEDGVVSALNALEHFEQRQDHA
jgi:predicted NAD/FAD-binding protein